VIDISGDVGLQLLIFGKYYSGHGFVIRNPNAAVVDYYKTVLICQ
jgi:hypothetical protein